MIEIVERLQEELHRFESAKSLAAIMHAPYNTVYRWWRGDVLPDAYNLSLLCYLGCDIVYILTGRRTTNDETGIENHN